MRKLLTVSAMALLLAGCDSMGPKQTAGTLIGAAGGALVGSQIGGGSGQIVGTALGTLGGAALGSYVGKSMDDKDKK